MTSRTDISLSKNRARDWRARDRLADLDGELPAQESAYRYCARWGCRRSVRIEYRFCREHAEKGADGGC